MHIGFVNKPYRIKAGDWFFIPAGVRHSYTHFSTERFEKHWIHFDLYPNDSLPRLLRLPHLVRVGSDPEPGALFETLTAANDSNTLTDKLKAKVALLALQTELPVLQIAERVGFQDQSHFSRLFRRYYAMTPTQCRNQHKT